MSHATRADRSKHLAGVLASLSGARRAAGTLVETIYRCQPAIDGLDRAAGDLVAQLERSTATLRSARPIVRA